MRYDLETIAQDLAEQITSEIEPQERFDVVADYVDQDIQGLISGGRGRYPRDWMVDRIEQILSE